MKKRIIISVTAAAVLIAALGVAIGVFRYYHPTHYLFNDKFIIGNTYENIVGRYGKFSISNPVHGYLVKPSNAGFFGSNRPEYYVVRFENGIATEVYIEEGGWGG